VDYKLDEHRHRFAAWAAARAALRGLTDVANLKTALDNCGVRKYLVDANFDDVDDARFIPLHRGWCRSIIKSLEDAPVRNVTFGRAAKLIAIYLKSAVVLGTGSGTAFARVAHPPIDAILLRNLAASSTVSSVHKRKWAGTKWTTLTEAEYYALMLELRQVLRPEDPFWMLEEHWTVTPDGGM
jgi:hypothetical protein